MTQIIISGAISFLVAIFLTPLLIRRFSAEGLGQEIREDGPRSHLRKRGTPTMGGIAILAGIIVAYVATNIVGTINGKGGFTVSGILVLGLTLALGGLGFADDYIKLAQSRNLGLNKKAKLIGQAAVALVFGFLVLQFKDEYKLTPGSTHLSYIRDIPTVDISLGAGVFGFILFMLFIYILISAWSNAVNLTDGLDGLLAGSATLVFATFSLVNIWQFNQWCGRVSSVGPLCYEVRDPYDLAVVSTALAGSCFGFLWWNAKPARIFMGDTGSMAIGAALAGLSIMTRTELLLVIMGFLFVMEAGSVALQVGYFKATKGKRIFKMSPIHHHFELLGWQEVTVVIRFWIICGLCVAIGVGIFYAEWVVGQ